MSVIHLPNGGSVPVSTTAKERKAEEREAQFMKTYPTREEVWAVVKQTANEAANNVLYFILANYELTPKTEEGTATLERITQAPDLKQALSGAQVTQITTDEARAEAEGRVDRG